jgi:hypothetical protein
MWYQRLGMGVSNDEWRAVPRWIARYLVEYTTVIGRHTIAKEENPLGYYHKAEKS